MTSESQSAALTIKLTAEDCKNVRWTLVEQTDTYRSYVGHGTHPATGQEITVQKREFLAEDALLALNAQERNDRDGRSFTSGMGSDKGGNLPMVHVGRVPLNKFFADIVPQLQQGDTEHAKWWLEREENQPFRTRNGKL